MTLSQEVINAVIGIIQGTPLPAEGEGEQFILAAQKKWAIEGVTPSEQIAYAYGDYLIAEIEKLAPKGKP